MATKNLSKLFLALLLFSVAISAGAQVIKIPSLSVLQAKQAAIDTTASSIAAKAPLASPSFSGVPKIGTDTVATNAYARFVSGGGGGGSSFPTQQSYTSGSTITITNQATDIWLLVNPSSIISALTITMPATLVDGQKIEISFGGTITTGTVVTSLSLAANSGHTILLSPTGSVQAGETISYRYKTSNTTLYRIL